jgi:hypothetical protein
MKESALFFKAHDFAVEACLAAVNSIRANA